MIIVSGGQTGIDRIALEVAKELNINTAGIAPKGFRTETGNDLSLKEFGLTEHTSSEYNPRTEANILTTGRTILFGDMNSPGSKLAIKLCKQHGKPFLTNPTVEQIKEFVKNKHIVNVGGNRGSKLSPEKAATYRETLKQGLA